MKKFISIVVVLIILMASGTYIRSTNPRKFDDTVQNIYGRFKKGASILFEKGKSGINDVLISFGSPKVDETNTQGAESSDGGLSSAFINNVKEKLLTASGMPNSKYTVNTHNEYYDAILESLNNYEKSVTIRLNNYNEDTYSLETVQQVMNDNFDRDYFVKSIGGTIYSGNKLHAITITFDYAFDRDTMLRMSVASEAKSREIISKIIKPGMTDIKKERAIHDYIVKNTSYDFNNLVRGTLPPESYSIYGTLINKKAVCEGYAKSMYKLLNLAGIENKVVVGEADGVPHAWNLVKINGSYTHVDATWDDPVTGTKEGILSYQYFNISDKKISKTHKWDTSKYPKGGSVPLK